MLRRLVGALFGLWGWDDESVDVDSLLLAE